MVKVFALFLSLLVDTILTKQLPYIVVNLKPQEVSSSRQTKKDRIQLKNAILTMTKSYVQAMAYSSIMLSIQYFFQSTRNFAKLKPIET